MNPPAPFQIELIELTDGTRIVRVSDPFTATALERRLDHAQPVAQQKEAVDRALRAVLERELKATAQPGHLPNAVQNRSRTCSRTAAAIRVRLTFQSKPALQLIGGKRRWNRRYTLQGSEALSPRAKTAHGVVPQCRQAGPARQSTFRQALSRG
jgi:hypothetical protein